MHFGISPVMPFQSATMRVVRRSRAQMLGEIELVMNQVRPAFSKMGSSDSPRRSNTHGPVSTKLNTTTQVAGSSTSSGNVAAPPAPNRPCSRSAVPEGGKGYPQEDKLDTLVETPPNVLDKEEGLMVGHRGSNGREEVGLAVEAQKVSQERPPQHLSENTGGFGPKYFVTEPAEEVLALTQAQIKSPSEQPSLEIVIEEEAGGCATSSPRPLKFLKGDVSRASESEVRRGKGTSQSPHTKSARRYRQRSSTNLTQQRLTDVCITSHGRHREDGTLFNVPVQPLQEELANYNSQVANSNLGAKAEGGEWALASPKQPFFPC
ncbi:hypothetical protein HYC85_002186 [Camellia sinensis]|uniref:Uncharacterized protein n=1 Tax=Camellia sinensis TaxID=4442 RepID=A0A7J7I8Y6_CAMSI|nr:hypothetical protein HYC85_002186 [Camellia sinensis]